MTSTATAETEETEAEFHRGYEAGNYSGAYNVAVDHWQRIQSKEYREGFILGFYSSYEVGEIPSMHRGLVGTLREKHHGRI